MAKNEETSYLCFEFSDLLLSKYINYANPSIEIRIKLMKQFVEFIIQLNNQFAKLDHIDLNYIFIEGLEDPVLKIFYNGIRIYIIY